MIVGTLVIGSITPGSEFKNFASSNLVFQYPTGNRSFPRTNVRDIIRLIFVIPEFSLSGVKFMDAFPVRAVSCEEIAKEFDFRRFSFL
jgi:hypothetical protein